MGNTNTAMNKMNPKKMSDVDLYFELDRIWIEDDCPEMTPKLFTSYMAENFQGETAQKRLNYYTWKEDRW